MSDKEVQKKLDELRHGAKERNNIKQEQECDLNKTGKSFGTQKSMFGLQMITEGANLFEDD